MPILAPAAIIAFTPMDIGAGVFVDEVTEVMEVAVGRVDDDTVDGMVDPNSKTGMLIGVEDADELIGPNPEVGVLIVVEDTDELVDPNSGAGMLIGVDAWEVWELKEFTAAVSETRLSTMNLPSCKHSGACHVLSVHDSRQSCDPVIPQRPYVDPEPHSSPPLLLSPKWQHILTGAEPLHG
ncbi:hypothetical protein NHQ30_011101 [Ciborinia camelliae]|nr:hypothetical protein NHQ30_011101 [Ciborinia camelliae]